MPVASLECPLDERAIVFVEIGEDSVLILKVAVRSICLDSDSRPSKPKLMPARDRS